MAIYNTITIAPSGSTGWGDTTYTGVTPVDYFYAPYEGSFLYANSADFYQPFPVISAGAGGVSVPTYNTDYTLFNQGGNDFYPYEQPYGRTILRFPRLAEQNPQITPANAYYPYNPDTGETQNQKVAEYAALPSVHLKMTIQPVRFNNNTYFEPISLATTEAAINNLDAEYSPVYVEMIGTSNAKTGDKPRASNYVETAYINNETLTEDIHVYQWEQILTSQPGNYNNYGLEHSTTISDTQFPMGTRDIYFEAPNPSIVDNGNPALLPYEGFYSYPDSTCQILYSNLNNYTNNNTYRHKLIQSLGHLPPLYGQHFASDNSIDEVKGGLVNTWNQIATVSVGEEFYIYDNWFDTSTTGYNSNVWTQVLHAQQYFAGTPVDENQEPNTIPSRIILNWRKDEGWEGASPNLLQFVEDDPLGSNDQKVLYNGIAICEVVHYDSFYRRAKVKLIQTIKHAYEGGGGDRWVTGANLTYLEVLKMRILLDIPVPTPNSITTGFNDICQFSLMVSHLGNYNVTEQHFRQAYCAYTYLKWYNYNESTLAPLTQFSTLNSAQLNNYSPQASGGGFSWNVAGFSYSQTYNLNYYNDRNGFFGVTSTPFNTINLADYDACLAPYTIKFNPQRFGLVYDTKNQEFILQIPRIPPCIIKGTYQVF